jgi:hypothetical protein
LFLGRERCNFGDCIHVSSKTLKTLLFITYYFPPSGGSGVQRGVKFVRYLPEFGWKVIVLTVDPQYAAFPALDETFAQELPPDLEIHRTKAFNPFDVYAKLRGKSKADTMTVGTLGEQRGWMAWLRANLFIPDARVGWNKYAIRKGLEIIKKEKIDAIFTTSPPHSTHLIGRALHRKTGIPWLADFRDPWTDISYYKELPHTPLARQLDARLERSVLSEATRITIVTPYYLDLMKQKVGKSGEVAKSLSRESERDKFVLLRNGFDENDQTVVSEQLSIINEQLSVISEQQIANSKQQIANSKNQEPENQEPQTSNQNKPQTSNQNKPQTSNQELATTNQKPQTRNFHISYVGSLFINPDGVWEALHELRSEMPELRVNLTGRIEAKVVESLKAHGLGDLLTLEPYLTHPEAITRMQSADVLLLVIEDSPHTKGILTGKIYEYVATGRPILGVGPLGGDAAQFLDEVQAGALFAHNDTGGIKAFLRQRYASWKQGNAAPEDRSERLKPYTRRALTEHLARILDEMTTP